jgi:hypothetical protein
MYIINFIICPRLTLPAEEAAAIPVNASSEIYAAIL